MEWETLCFKKALHDLKTWRTPKALIPLVVLLISDMIFEENASRWRRFPAEAISLTTRGVPPVQTRWEYLQSQFTASGVFDHDLKFYSLFSWASSPRKVNPCEVRR